MPTLALPHTGSPKLVLAAIFCMTTLSPAMAGNGEDFANLSLEELANIQITSVSRRAEPLNKAAASLYVITADAIRRSSATSLPEALRLAPNLQVAQIDANQYAISARGFNNAIGNKLLVLIDGRTVYSPFFSGVLWDQQNVMLEDVERIEVISGPGATIWGANAVNGVINVITRSSADTQGGLFVARAGNQEHQFNARYGAPLGEAGHFRVYVQTGRRDNTVNAAQAPVRDSSDRQQGGFRADLGSGADRFTLQGDAYRTKAEHRGFFGPFELTPVVATGANLLARWTRQLAGGGDIRVQAYYDHAKREDALLYNPDEDVLDLEFQHAIPFASHRLQWGAGHRRARDDIQPGVFFGFVPASRTNRWTNLFVQDEIQLHERVALTLGLKLEHNDYTGTEQLPNVRATWSLAEGHMLWGALSRAIRAPARLDREVVLPPRPPYIIAGGPNFVSEVANVTEVGYRGQPSPVLSYSATLFHHDWTRLRSGQPPPNALVQNMISGHTYGAEAWANWQAATHWRLSAGMTALHKNLSLDPGSTDPVGPSNLGNDPKFQWTLRSAFNLPNRQELDIGVRHVGELPEPAVPSYTAVDLRYGWRVRTNIDVSVAVRNLFDEGHPEFGNFPDRSEIGRSVFLQLSWDL